MRLGNTLRRAAVRIPGRAHVVVLGNEKGGSGKSTTAMHLAVALLYDGARVGTIDVDSRQGTFTRYIENRRNFAKAQNLDLPSPEHRTRAAERSGQSQLKPMRPSASASARLSPSWLPPAIS